MLDKEEARAILQKPSGGRPMSDAAFERLFSKIDTDNSGAISPEEFIAYTMNAKYRRRGGGGGGRGRGGRGGGGAERKPGAPSVTASKVAYVSHVVGPKGSTIKASGARWRSD